ncbi:axoneme-associated protein mst101(2) isoform X1 [Bactrocera oleae]|uniref:axoneme-associated protein mst101(2) isoform X1 n=2 Tax=Bactrocera oleae TaxID=104688 RepID=UPI0006B7C473|nr:trichohyalin isoform X1 [Bactrocera oleae]XP_036233233.1 trichohyalin isoform X1 [Bactrocera oleae]XP_036233234.1 trichohyalin isoform X1 [Bactrocera oleae]
MPFVAPKSATSSTTGRTTFRPPWVKEDSTANAKPSVPWAKKTAATTGDKDKEKEKEKEKENGEKTTSTLAAKKTTTPVKKVNETTAAGKKTVEPVKKATVEPLKKNAEPTKKVIEPVKRVVEPTKKVVAPVKKAPEPLVAKKPTTTTATKTAAAAVKKKEPTPSSSEEEETEEEEEEETEEEESEEEEEESEEDANDKDVEDLEGLSDLEFSENEFTQPSLRLGVKLKKTPQVQKKENESELTRRFSIEKPKLRPVMVKRDKSMKKIEGDSDDDEDENEEERERQLRFKLEKPKLRHVKREEKPLPSKSTEDIMKIRPVLKKVSKIDEILKEPKEEPKPEFKTKQLRKAPSIKREPSMKNVPAPPPLPSLVPKAPPPPPPPLGAPGEKRNISETQKAALEKLKTRPRRRPDWSEMMKEVESGRKLRHVECNDRSQPILTCKSMTKVDNKFIYETEKDNSHNKLLKQIQGGIKLKPTQTNDRSKPFIGGLRKFRKQMTIEEQIQKSQSKINLLAEAATAAVGAAVSASGTSDPAVITNSIVAALSIDDPSGDELDDIDKIRDDLQSTKQMLALELRNREAQDRENKKLIAQIATLEAELEREKSREKNLEYGSRIIVATMDPTPASEEAYLNSLKQEADDARRTAKDLEKKYLDTGELLDQAKSEIDEQKRTIQMLERKLAQALQDEQTTMPCPICAKRQQAKYFYSYDDPDDVKSCFGFDNFANGYTNMGGGSLNGSRRPSDVHGGRDSSPELDLDMSESDPDEPEEKKLERRDRRLAKEVKVLRSKLTKVKVKREAAKKEKLALKQAMKKNHAILKEENKKFKKLEKEVQKMAASMKEEEEDEEGDEEKEEEEEDEEDVEESEEEEESEESESEESEAETESESEGEDASNADKKSNLEPRLKKHESRLLAMKKCNVLLQANVDNLQDEITQIRAKAANLQAELDAVLADLGF